MRVAWIGLVAVALVGCGGDSTVKLPTGDGDPISDLASPQVSSATIGEEPSRPASNGIALTTISGDGKVMAFVNGTGSVRWGLNVLGGADISLPTNVAASGQGLYSLSNDGSSYAYGDTSTPNQVTLHQPAGDTSITLPHFEYLDYVFGVSSNGTTVTGTEHGPSTQTHAFRWSEAEGFVILEPALQRDELIHGISSDGRVIVGGDKIARRWVGSGAAEQIVTGNYRYSKAAAVSADGTMVAGSVFGGATSAWTAFRWEEGVGLKRIGHYPGFLDSVAKYMSADGKVVVGEVSRPGQPTPFIWTSASGMKLLRDLEPSINPLLMNPDQPIRVAGLSADGKVIIGGRYDRTGYFPEHAWVAKLEFK